MQAMPAPETKDEAPVGPARLQSGACRRKCLIREGTWCLPRGKVAGWGGGCCGSVWCWLHTGAWRSRYDDGADISL